MSRALAAFTREQITAELADLTMKAARQRAFEHPPTSDERLLAVAHLGTQLRIVELYEPIADDDGLGDYEFAYGIAYGLGKAVRRIAAIYADRSGYQEEWAP